MYKMRKANNPPTITANRLIADLMTAIGPLEKYLKRRRPLTRLQLESLSLALRTLETFLAVWKAGKGYKDTRSKDKTSGSWFLDVMEKSRNDRDENKHQVNSNWAAVTLGRMGGQKGGHARAKKLSAKRRTAIARLAVRARWARRKQI